MACNLDGITTTSQEASPAVWDAKHVGRADDTAVMRYTPQMTHNCTVCWARLVGDQLLHRKLEMQEVVEQEVDPLYQAELIVKETAFWRYVEAGRRADGQHDPGCRAQARSDAAQDRPDRSRLDRYNWSADIVRERSSPSPTLTAPPKAHAIARQKIGELLPDDVGELRLGLFKLTRNKAGALTMSVGKPR